MSIKFFLFSFLLIAFISCEDDTQSYKFPLADTHNIDDEALEKAYQKGDDIRGLGALIVERNGVVVAEEYFDDYKQSDKFNVKSVTKSVTSLLIGIALERGDIDSLDQKATDYIGHLIDENDLVKKSLTIEQILNMTSGFEWGEWEDETIYNQWVRSSDQINFLYDQKMKYTPGEKFTYNSALTHLLSVIIEESTGMSELEYAKKYLFSPMGITDVDWYEFDQGYNNGGADLMIRPIDMVKLGRMCLEGGQYNGAQVVPSDWIAESTAKQVSTDNLFLHGEHYGYLWWRGRENGYDFFWALGYGGQFIVCVPDQDLVVVATSNFQLPLVIPSALWVKVEDLIMNDVLPCVY